MPAAAEITSSARPMPVSSAALSPVPKRAIAVSFAHDGAKSMSSEPTTNTGLAIGATIAAASSAAPRPSATEAMPARAGSSQAFTGEGRALMRAAYVRIPWECFGAARLRLPRASARGRRRRADPPDPQDHADRRDDHEPAEHRREPERDEGGEHPHVQVADARAAGHDDREDPLQPPAHVVGGGDEHHRRAEDRTHLVRAPVPAIARPASTRATTLTREKSTPTGPNHPVCIAATTRPNSATNPP